MTIIGLTGPSGTGKGLLCNYAKTLDIPSVDTDEVYHSLIAAPSLCTEELANRFGGILTPDGTVDRRALASIVFAPGAASLQEELNVITHKYVRQKTIELLTQYKKQRVRAVIVDAPLLYEAGFDDMCDFCIAVIAPYEARYHRIISRDGLSHDQACSRLAAQKPNEYYTSRSKYTIQNNDAPEMVYKQARAILTAEGLL